MTFSSDEHGDEQIDQVAPRARRRAQRPSEAKEIDRSWDDPQAAQLFESHSPDSAVSDEFVELDDEPGAPAEDSAGDFDAQFWQEQRPPHYSS